MAVYTVKDNSTGRTISFNWNGETAPTDTDMQEVFAAAGNVAAKPTQVDHAQNIADAQKVLAQENGRPEESMSFGQQLLHEAPALAGSIALPMAATGIGVPGAIGLGALGAALGKAGQMIYGDVTGEGPKNQTSLSRIAQLAETGGLYAAGDVAGRSAFGAAKPAIQAVANRLGKPLGEGLTSAGKQAQEWISSNAGKATDAVKGLIPGEGTNIGGLEFLRNIADSGIGSGTAIRNAISKRYDQIFKPYAEETLGKYGADINTDISPSELGKYVSDKFSTNWKEFKTNVTDPLYAEIKDKLSNLKINGEPLSFDTAPLKEAFAKEIKTVGELGGSSNDALLGFAKKIEALPERISFDAADLIRKEWGGAAKELKLQGNTGPLTEMYGRALGTLKSDIVEPTIKSIDKDLFKQKTELDAFYGSAKEKLMGKDISQFVKASIDNPETAVKKLMRSDSSYISRIKEALPEEDFKKVQGYVLKNILKSIETGSMEGQINGKALSHQIARYGKDKMSALFGPAAPNITEFAKALETVQAGTSNSSGSMLIQMKQSGAIMQAVGLGAMGAGAMTAGGAVLITPVVLARIFTNPSLAKMLTEGLGTKIGSPRAAVLAGKIAAAVKDSESSNVTQKDMTPAPKRGIMSLLAGYADN